MNQTLLGAIRAVGYPVLFAALGALAQAIPGVQGLPLWLPAGMLVVIIGILEHQLAVYLGYNFPSNPGISQ